MGSGTDQDKTTHWQAVYQHKRPQEVSWYQPHLQASTALLKQAGLNPHSRVIDVGAGAATLVDDLLDLGVQHITALDISAASLEVARARLGPRAAPITWLVADLLHARLQPDGYDLWHDRAVLHFLVDPADAATYVGIASRAIAQGGYAIIAGFAADGPERCSQLPVARRDPQDIASLFGSAFSLQHALHERHVTPWGTTQSFAYALLRKA